jgi:hypothetical protein
MQTVCTSTKIKDIKRSIKHIKNTKKSILAYIMESNDPLSYGVRENISYTDKCLEQYIPSMF